MPTSGFAENPSLSYREAGAGQPLLLLHGWGMAGACFDPTIAALQDRFRLIAPDLRGHGASPPLAPHHGFATLVEDVACLMRTLGLVRTVLVGWSMGALVCWALMHGAEAARVRGVVTVDMVPRLLNHGEWRFGLRHGRDASVYAGAARRMRANWPAFTRSFVPRLLARGAGQRRARLRDRLVRLAEPNHGPSMAALWLSMVELDYRGLLPGVRVPCLVTCGERSQLYRVAASRWVAGQLPDARLVRFADAGHALHLEQSQRFTQELAAFVHTRTRGS